MAEARILEDVRAAGYHPLGEVRILWRSPLCGTATVRAAALPAVKKTA